jgi:hypothetical protein
MDFEIKNLQKGIVEVARELGYLIIDTRPNNEYNLVRRLTGQNYPRFHIYLRAAGDRFVFSLHLDQKKPSYEGSHAHSGEYDGPLIQDEADRIRQLLAVSL